MPGYQGFDPDPVGSGVLPGSVSGSGFKITLDPDPVSAPGVGSLAKKGAERALRVNY